MDILKRLMSNPGFHHIAETIIGYMDREVAQNLVGNHELLSDEEQKFLMKTLRRSMFHEAQLICDKTYCFFVWTGVKTPAVKKSIFQMFPFFVKALQELRTSEEFASFKLLCEILLLLEDLTNETFCPYGFDLDDFRLECLHRYIDPDDQDDQDDQDNQDAKGPKDMIKILKEADDEYHDEYQTKCDVMWSMMY